MRRGGAACGGGGAAPLGRRAALAMMLGVVIALGACGRGSPAPSGTGPRYVVLSPALAVMLRDLGQEDRIVARHAYDLVLSEDRPVAGELGRIDYEVLLASRPTHVLIEWGDPSQPLPERLVGLARERGIEVMRFSMLTLDDIIAAVERLEADLPPSDRGPEPGAWPDQMRRAWQDRRIPGEAWPRYRGAGRVLLVASTDPVIGVIGPGSWHHQIIEAVGGVPAIEDGAPWMELTPEDVLRLAPEAIILIQPRAPGVAAGGIAPSEVAAETQRRLGPLARLDIPAVRNGCVGVIDDPLSHTPSTAMVGLTQRVEGLLASWAARAERSSALPGL